MDGFAGVILWHKSHGYCKVIEINQRQRLICVRFCGADRDAQYSSAVVGKDLLHKPLPLESLATVDGRGTCQIIKVPSPGSGDDFYLYVVRFDETGDSAELDEREISPLSAHPKETLLSRMGSCDPHSLYKVTARHQFLLALEDLYKETSGLEALIASRVELLPHQAYVAGVVINDAVRRFILADEVGLGKTIEAGLVITDLLAVKPDAKVLILTPGALSRQWLCELHISFGGQGFRLADLHKVIEFDKWDRVICSINRAIFSHRKQFEKNLSWDLVVVDEAHHLLWNPEAYQLIEKMSRASKGLLLLSAVPAREREDELLRLLRLLDPERYGEDKQVAKCFAELYRAQSQLGQGLRILDRDISDLGKGDAVSKDLELPLTRIMRAPVIADDVELQTACRNVITMSNEQALDEVRSIRDLIVSRYRLSRRVIKNRRSQLISQEFLHGVNREFELIPYEADGFEIDAWLSLEAILEQIAKSNATSVTKHAFFKLALSSMSDPVCAGLLADELGGAIEKQVNGAKVNLFATSYGVSYDEFFPLLEDIAVAVSPHLDGDSVARFSDATNSWIDAPGTKERLSRLQTCLKGLFLQFNKIIIFAGAYGVAGSLATDLKDLYGHQVVEVFTFDLSDAEKETNVLRFRSNEGCHILVSDETGGEGRNFQFVDVIIHYDLPWSIAAIEQRVGRLDRIGRTRPVKSYLLFQENSIEEGFIKCLVDGFRVFTISISGLEFMLKDAESKMMETALSLDGEQLAAMAPQIALDADAERRTDDAEALTDAGSFPGFGKVRVLHEIADPLEQRLEDGFVAYFRSLARQGSAHQFADNQQPNLKLWRFRPDEISTEPLPGIRKGVDDLFAEHCGTFRRLVARERRDLEFFSVGNSLFDSVVSVALGRLSGRVFAIRVHEPEVEAGNYLAMGMRCVVPSNAIDDSVPLQRRVNRYFFSKRVYLTYKLGEEAVLDSVRLSEVVRGALIGKRECADLTKLVFHQLIDGAVGDWTDYLVRIQEIAFRDAKTAYQSKFGSDHASLMEQLRKERSELEHLPIGQGRDVDALQTLEHAIEGWQPAIDVIGVMQVAI